MNHDTLIDGAHIVGGLSSVGGLLSAAQKSHHDTSPKECWKRGRQHLHYVLDTLETHQTKIPDSELTELLANHQS